MAIRTTSLTLVWMGLSAFALYMLIDRLWVHSPMPYAIMFGIIVAVVCVGSVPFMNDRLRRLDERKRTRV
jgi:hypothetical protein